MNSIITADIDHDGNLDLILGGNLYGSEAETPRNDASIGLFMKGDGKGGFKPVPANESGLYMEGDVKGTCLIKTGTQVGRMVIAAKNSGRLQIIRIID